MSGAQDLYGGLDRFSRSIRDLRTSRLINEATSAAEAIKGVEAGTAAQKRKQNTQLKGLGEALALRLSSVGSSASQIKQAFDAIAPDVFGSQEQLRLATQQFGGEGFVALEQESFEQSRDRGRSEKLFDVGLKTQAAQSLAKQRAAAKLRERFAIPGEVFVPGVTAKMDVPRDILVKNTPDASKALTMRDEVGSILDDLIEQVEKTGSTASLFNLEGKAKLEALTRAAQLTVKGKGMFDLGVLNGSDAEFLRAIIPSLGGAGALFISDSAAIAKLKEARTMVARNTAKRLKTLGFDLPGVDSVAHQMAKENKKRSTIASEPESVSRYIKRPLRYGARPTQKSSGASQVWPNPGGA